MKMVETTRANISMIKSMDKESILGPMVNSMMVDGKMANNMVKHFLRVLKDNQGKVYWRMGIA